MSQYLALVFAESWLGAAVWQQTGAKTTVVMQSKLVPLKSNKSQDVNSAVDTALDDLGESGLSLKNVLFVLPHTWIRNNDVIPDMKRLLKGLSQDLLLEPLGFVVLTDTIVAAEMEKTGKAFSGLILLDTPLFWDIAVFQNGNETQTEHIGKSGELTADITELRARLKGTQPARILFLPQLTDDTSDTQTALEQSFQTSLEVLESKTLLEKSVSLGGAEVLANKTGQEKLAPDTEGAEENITPQETHPKHAPNSPLLNAPPPGMQAPPGFGVPSFAQAAGAPTKEEEFPETETSPAPFVINNHHPVGEEDEESAENGVRDTLSLVDDPEHLTPEKKSRFPHFSFSGLHLPQLSGIFKKKGKLTPLLLGGGVALLLLLGGGYFFLQQSYTAQVTLWIKPKNLEAQQTFLIGAGGTATEGATLDASVFLEKVTLDKEVPTTGTKIIGDKAKGKVTLFNKTLQEKEFPAGTKITTGSVTFILDSAVKIASASSSNRSTEHGSAQVSVTAAAIGPESNIARKQTFTVGNFDTSSYTAENDDAFTGGAKREIQAVAKSDVEKAANELAQAAKSQMKETIQSKAQNPGEVVLFTDQTRVSEVKTSVEVGAEAKFVSVTTVVEGVGIRITPEVLKETAEKFLKDQLGESQQLLTESISFSPENVTQLADGKYQLKGKIVAKTVPQVAASEVQSKLPGVYIERVKSELLQDSRIAKVDISLSPSGIGALFTKLPGQTKNIQLNIRLDQSQ